MAIVFELWVQGEDEADHERLVEHFAGFEFTLSRGAHTRWTAETGTPSSALAGVSVWSRHLSRFGVRTVQDAVDMTEAGMRLYHHLLSAPRFRYARVALEAANVPMNELCDYISTYPDGQRDLGISCVVDDGLLRELGDPLGFRPFRDGCSWKPYRGEDYRPLGSTDYPELHRLYAELFPA